MKDLHKDLKLPKLETEEEIENFFKSGNDEFKKNSVFEFSDKDNGLLNLNENKINDIKSALNGLSENKITLIQQEVLKKLNNSNKLLNSSKNFTISSIILFIVMVFTLMGLGSSSSFAHLSLFVYVISFFTFAFTSIASIIQFFRSILNYMGTYGEASLLGFKYNIMTWVISIFIMFLLFPPFALLFGYFFKSDIKSKLNKYLLENGMPSLEDIEKNLIKIK